MSPADQPDPENGQQPQPQPIPIMEQTVYTTFKWEVSQMEDGSRQLDIILPGGRMLTLPFDKGASAKLSSAMSQVKVADMGDLPPGSLN